MKINKMYTCEELGKYTNTPAWKIARLTWLGYLKPDVKPARGSGTRNLYSHKEAKRAKVWLSRYKRYHMLRRQLGLRVGGG